ncbi:MAG: efflux RND transporter periplasmic adaptor subunit [Bacteroidales bacterium]|nr:efflux RND transporter periplasmic adaptor subunit [Bacteroidales bacterium]
MKHYDKILQVLLLLSINGFLFSCGHKKQEVASSSVADRPYEVKAIVATPRELENRIYTTGTILANEEVEIRAELPGRITAINFQEGSYVKKGFLLLLINDSELQAQLKKLTLDEQLAREDVFRKEKLLEIKAISQEEFDIAQNQLGVIQANMELVSSQIDKTKIYAPFSGRIGLRHVSPGGFISSANLVARMQQTDPVKIEFTVPEKYIANITVGMQIEFTVAGNDSTFTGAIYAIEPRIDLSTRTFAVRARCVNPGNVLIPGAFARITIILEKISDALALPSEAIIPDMMGKKVMLVRNGQVKSVYVETGIHTEYEVQVTSGINPLDTVIISGLLQLRENMPVKPTITTIN